MLRYTALVLAFLFGQQDAAKQLTDEQLEKIELQADLTKCQARNERIVRQLEKVQKELDELKKATKDKPQP